MTMCEYDVNFNPVGEWEESDAPRCEEPATVTFGDMLVCRSHAHVMARLTVNPRCPACGYWNDAREAGDRRAPCGEPCL